MRQPALRDEANMTNQLFEAALGIKAPWYVQGVDFDAAKRQLTIAVDFVAGSRFPIGDEANMTKQLFEAALGIKAPWYVQGVDFDAAKRQLTIAVDFVAGSRFAYPRIAGEAPVHDTQIK